MLYASSREVLRRSLQGIAKEIQGTDSSEVTYEAGMYWDHSILSTTPGGVPTDLSRFPQALEKALKK